MADEDLDPLIVKSVYESGIAEGSVPGSKHSSGERRRHRRFREHKKVRGYLHPLFKAAEQSNRLLHDQKLPYRFCVFERDEEVYIDLVILDTQGKIQQEKIRRITHEDFNRLIEDVSQIEGLFVDETG